MNGPVAAGWRLNLGRGSLSTLVERLVCRLQLRGDFLRAHRRRALGYDGIGIVASVIGIVRDDLPDDFGARHGRNECGFGRVDAAFGKRGAGGDEKRSGNGNVIDVHDGMDKWIEKK